MANVQLHHRERAIAHSPSCNRLNVLHRKSQSAEPRNKTWQNMLINSLSYQQKHALINTLSILLKENSTYFRLLAYICNNFLKQ